MTSSDGANDACSSACSSPTSWSLQEELHLFADVSSVPPQGLVLRDTGLIGEPTTAALISVVEGSLALTSSLSVSAAGPCPSFKVPATTSTWLETAPGHPTTPATSPHSHNHAHDAHPVLFGSTISGIIMPHSPVRAATAVRRRTAAAAAGTAATQLAPTTAVSGTAMLHAECVPMTPAVANGDLAVRIGY